uniref:Bifunctional protein GlmU n=1 Tax=Cacopsylla melanoneura TaxID=428564 RepID=A0A8D8VCG0_9HEMI
MTPITLVSFGTNHLGFIWLFPTLFRVGVTFSNSRSLYFVFSLGCSYIISNTMTSSHIPLDMTQLPIDNMIHRSDDMRVFTMRLHRGQDLRKKLEQLLIDRRLKCAFIISCVGSLSKCTLRYASSFYGEEQIQTLNEYTEIVSLVGTLSQEGCHLHLSVADSQGGVKGGHLMGGDSECIVQTTAEIVLGCVHNIEFGRVMDPSTGYKELVIRNFQYSHSPVSWLLFLTPCLCFLLFFGFMMYSR